MTAESQRRITDPYAPKQSVQPVLGVYLRSNTEPYIRVTSVPRLRGFSKSLTLLLEPVSNNDIFVDPKKGFL